MAKEIRPVVWDMKDPLTWADNNSKPRRTFSVARAAAMFAISMAIGLCLIQFMGWLLYN